MINLSSNICSKAFKTINCNYHHKNIPGKTPANPSAFSISSSTGKADIDSSLSCPSNADEGYILVPIPKRRPVSFPIASWSPEKRKEDIWMTLWGENGVNQISKINYDVAMLENRSISLRAEINMNKGEYINETQKGIDYSKLEIIHYSKHRKSLFPMDHINFSTTGCSW